MLVYILIGIQVMLSARYIYEKDEGSKMKFWESIQIVLVWPNFLIELLFHLRNLIIDDES